eukprot:2874266-Prymnesium_polylepis.1
MAAAEEAVRSTCVSHSKIRRVPLHVRAVVYAPDWRPSRKSLELSSDGAATPSTLTTNRGGMVLRRAGVP